MRRREAVKFGWKIFPSGKMAKILPPQEPIPILECSLNFHRTNLLKKALEAIITLNDDVPVVIKSSMDHGLVIQAHPERRSNNSYVVASINVPKNNFIRYCFAAKYTHFTVPINMLMEGLISLGDKDDMSIITYFQDLLEYIHGYMYIKSLRFLTERPTIVYTQMLMHECQYFNYVLDTIYEGLVGIPSSKLVDILRHYDNSEGDDLDISISDTRVKLSVGDDEGVILDKDQNQCIIGGFDFDTEVSVPLDDVRDSWYLALRFTKVVWIFISGDGYALYCFPILPLGNLLFIQFCFLLSLLSNGADGNPSIARFDLLFQKGRRFWNVFSIQGFVRLVPLYSITMPIVRNLDTYYRLPQFF